MEKLKRYNPFASYEETSESKFTQLAYHPNSFFTREDWEELQRTIRSLERIRTRMDAPDSPADVIFRDQLEQLMIEIELAPGTDSTEANYRFLNG